MKMNESSSPHVCEGIFLMLKRSMVLSSMLLRVYCVKSAIRQDFPPIDRTVVLWYNVRGGDNYWPEESVRNNRLARV